MSRFSTSRERHTIAKGTSDHDSHPVRFSARRARRVERLVCAGLCGTVLLRLGALVFAASLEPRDAVAQLTSWIKWGGLTDLVFLAGLLICRRPDA